MRQAIALMGTAILGLSAVAWGSDASAQEAPPWRQTMPAPSNSFELKVGTGYTQGFGNIAPGRSIINVAGAGIGVSADADYRINPMLSAGAEVQYQEFTTENNTGSRGLAANVGATMHAKPQMAGDPWMRLGVGYRFLWDVGHIDARNNTNMFHGFDLLTAKVGYDFRPSPDVALAPVVGADLQTFIWENSAALSKAQVGTFIYAGLQGRFDIGPTRETTNIANNYR
jgi:hypothetical protein